MLKERVIRWSGPTALGLVLVVLIMGQASKPAAMVHEELRARKFELVDENGQPRVNLIVTKDGPHLGFHDENGKVRVLFGVGEHTSSLRLHDENGKVRALLAAGKDVSALTLLDENGETRALLAAGKDGLGLAFYDESRKKKIWSAP